MKIVFFSFSDKLGGANKASYEIFKSLKDKEFKFFTIRKYQNDTIKINNKFNDIYLNFLRIIEKIIIFFIKKEFHQSLNLIHSFNGRYFLNKKFDIINFHWINRCSLSLKEIYCIKNKKVFSMHDLWFLNGSMHYGKDKYTCNIEKNLKYLKKKIVNQNNSFFIAHNNWAQNKFLEIYPEAKNKVFKCNYYPIDLNKFKVRSKKELRKKYKISDEKILIMFSCTNVFEKRKGFGYFKNVVRSFHNNDKFNFIIVGRGASKDKEINKLKNCFIFEEVDHDNLKEFYSMSDIYVCTSTTDNLPLSVLEAMSSGNVVISFNNGGVIEVLNKDNGYIVNNKDENAVIDLLEKLKLEDIRYKSENARIFAEKNFNQEIISSQYREIFDKIFVL